MEHPDETHKRRSASISPIAGLLLGVLASSTASIFIRYAQIEAASMAIAALRLSFATLMLTPLVISRYRFSLHSMRPRAVLLSLAAGSFLALHFATWITSLEFTSVASSVALVQIAPLFVAIFSPFFLKEPVGRNIAAGLFLSILGGIIIAASDACTWHAGLQCPALSSFLNDKAIHGDILAIIGALGAAGYILIGRKTRTDIDLIPYIFLVYASASLWLLFLTLLTDTSLTAFSSTTLLWILMLALIPQLFSHSAINWALRYLPAALVSVTLLGEPVASTIWAHFLLDETPPPLRIIGAALVLVGIAVAARSKES
jgi:drug/metabolite transporter (DMT)-like permease